jgi:phospholipid transport system substrate-binding protein
VQAAAPETSSPSRLIADTADAVARAVAAKHAEYEADPARLRAVADELLRPRFDLEASSRVILKDHWKTASPEERRRFVAAFYRFLLDSYADALLHFRNDTVTILPGEELAGESTARVRTSMKLRDGSRYKVDYAMRLGADGWKIVDVVAEGVSYVRTYRTDFGAEIRAKGLASLIERLEGKPPDKEPRTP